MHGTGRAQRGFTLIEMSIVLVIIGLIVGGVLVGQSLIAAAAVRATIAQVERYQTAVNTFRGKYGYLPGDLPDPQATQFGFTTRFAGWGTRGEGDGNGIIEGMSAQGPSGVCATAGEPVYFWMDLSTPGLSLIQGSFNPSPAVPYQTPELTTASTAPSIGNILPEAKLGGGNYFYVFSGGSSGGATTWNSSGINYFGLAAVSQFHIYGQECLFTGPGLTVAEALSIDQKLDDGLPISGNVTAQWLTPGFGWRNATYPNGSASGWNPAGPIPALPPDGYTCWDNNGVSGATPNYSIGTNGGSGVNCALSFRFQ